MYAIRNKRTKKWLFKTDFERGVAKHRTSENKAIIYPTYESADCEFKLRGCSAREFEIVHVELTVLEVYE